MPNGVHGPHVALSGLWRYERLTLATPEQASDAAASTRKGATVRQYGPETIADEAGGVTSEAGRYAYRNSDTPAGGSYRK